VTEIEKCAPERYRVEVRPRPPRWRWWRRWPAGLVHDVQIVTTHDIWPVGEKGEALPAVHVESELEHPPAVLGERWARWKGQRMVAAAHRRDVREGQPWTTS